MQNNQKIYDIREDKKLNTNYKERFVICLYNTLGGEYGIYKY